LLYARHIFWHIFWDDSRVTPLSWSDSAGRFVLSIGPFDLNGERFYH